MQKQQPRKNGTGGGQQKRRPQDELDLYQDVVDSTAVDDFLDQQNLGLGNYTKQEMWQQVESYKDGLFSIAAFKRLLQERAKEETKTALALDGWQVTTTDDSAEWAGWKDLSDEERRAIWTGKGDHEALQTEDGERFDRRRWINRRGEQVLTELYELRSESTNEYPAIEALGELSGWESDWYPAHMRMMMTRHEASRSKNAQLLDNVFGRVKEQVQDVAENLRGRR